MLCRSCGRESRTPQTCEWCRQPMTPAQPSAPMPSEFPPSQSMTPGAQPTVQMPPGAPPPYSGMPGSQPTMQMLPGMQTPPQRNATRRRVSLSGEVIEDDAPPPAPMAPTGVMPSRFSALPVAAYSPQAVQAQFRGSSATPIGERWEKFLAIALPLLAVSMLLVHFFPGSFIAVGFADMFFLPLALGAVGAVPSYDDAITDCSVILLVSLFINPALALVAYLIVCAIKQECNGALVALLLITLIVPFILLIPLITGEFSLVTLGLWGIFNWMSFLRLFVGFFGWLLSSFFRQENE